MRPSRNGRAGGRKTLVRRRSSNRPPVSRPPRCCRARSADRTGLSSVDRRPRRPSALSARPATSSKTTRTRTPRAASTLPGEDPRSCNPLPTRLFVCLRVRKKRGFRESQELAILPLAIFFVVSSKARIYANDINGFIFL